MAYVEQATVLAPAFVSVLLEQTRRLDLAPGPGGSRISDFLASTALYRPLFTEGPYAERWSRAMVVALYPSAQIVAHCDPPIEGIRIHIPLQINRGCWVFHDGVWDQLQCGSSYQMDPTLEHGAVNWGDTLRLHLVIDLVA